MILLKHALGAGASGSKCNGGRRRGAVCRAAIIVYRITELCFSCKANSDSSSGSGLEVMSRVIFVNSQLSRHVKCNVVGLVVEVEFRTPLSFGSIFGCNCPASKWLRSLGISSMLWAKVTGRRT